MKISQEQLKKIIKEELAKQLQEDDISGEQVDEIFGKLGSTVKNLGSKFANKLTPGGIARNVMAGANSSQQSASSTSTTTPATTAQQAPSAQVTKFTQGPSNSPNPVAQKPEIPAAAAQQGPAAKDPVVDSTADIVMPHAIVLKGLLTKQMAQSLQKVLGGLPPEQKKTVMAPVMQYINNLPSMASKVIAEEVTAKQKARDAEVRSAGKMSPEQLKAKHAGNISLIGKNLQTLEGEIMNSIKSQLNITNTPNLLQQAIDKKYGNSKEGLRYLDSLMKKPQAHLDALLQNAQLVVKNIISIVQKNMSKAPQGQAKLGGSSAAGASKKVEISRKDGSKVVGQTLSGEAAAQQLKAMGQNEEQIKQILQSIQAGTHSLVSFIDKQTGNPAAKLVPSNQAKQLAESYKATYDKWQKIIKG